MASFDAKNYIDITNKALDELRRVQIIKFINNEFNRPPRLSDFYIRSNKMEEYELLFIIGTGLVGGYLFYKIT